MGWINDAKTHSASEHAAKAYGNGDKVLAYKLIEANLNSKATAPMSGISAQIEAIESQGWALQHMSAAQGKTITSERIELVCVFRRTATGPEPEPPGTADARPHDDETT